MVEVGKFGRRPMRSPCAHALFLVNMRTRQVLRSLTKTTAVEVGLKDKSGVDKIIVEKQPYQLLDSREFFPGFLATNFHKFDDFSS